MQVITAGHVDVEEEVLNPYCGICCAVVRFNVYGFETFWELMFHYFVCEA